jgi:hypothetical protein
MPLKISLHIFSTDSDLKISSDTLDFDDIKTEYKKSKRIKRIRLDYAGTLLRQIFVVSMIRIGIYLLQMISFMPFIGMFTHYFHTFLIFLALLVQLPTTVLNFIILTLTDKFNLTGFDFRLNCPLSDKLIVWTKGFFGDSKLASIRTIRNIVLKYDNKNELDVDDGEKLMEALDNLGISREYLIHIGLDLNNLDTFAKKIKDNIDVIFAKGIQLIFDENNGIKSLFVDIINDSNNNDRNNKKREKSVNKLKDKINKHFD